MRTSTIVMIGFAVLFGLLAVFVAQSWLNSQAEQRMKSLEAQKKNRCDAARSWSRASRCASATSSRRRRCAKSPWPEDALPAGAFAKIADVTRRTASASCSPRSRRTSRSSPPRSPAPASAPRCRRCSQDGMKAVTIRVNDVEGVAGFVLPGDRVDVAADAPDRQGRSAHERRGAAERRACSRSIRSPTSAPTSRRWSRRSRSKSTRRGAEARARGFGRHAVAAAAQGRRSAMSPNARASRSAICQRRGAPIGRSTLRHGRR